jgi:hypothetical protein
MSGLGQDTRTGLNSSPSSPFDKLKVGDSQMQTVIARPIASLVPAGQFLGEIKAMGSGFKLENALSVNLSSNIPGAHNQKGGAARGAS